MKKNVAWLFLLGVLFLTGCGNQVGLGGKVTFSDDGSPLTSGTVYLVEGNFMARGPIQSDGSYIVGSVKEGDGLPPGTYSVYVSGATKEAGTDASGMPTFESLIDDKFASAQTSGLTVTVPAEKNRFDFKVDRK